MPRVHSQVARKDYPDQGIKKGDTYYKWTTRPGGRGRGILHRSATYPKPWQLTSSPFLQELYRIQHEQGELEPGEPGSGELDGAITDLAQRYRDLGEEQLEKLENMPDSLQYSPSGEMLQERADACEQAADELEDIASQLSDDSDEDELQSACDEAQAVEVAC